MSEDTIRTQFETVMKADYVVRFFDGCFDKIAEIQQSITELEALPDYLTTCDASTIATIEAMKGKIVSILAILNA